MTRSEEFAEKELKRMKLLRTNVKGDFIIPIVSMRKCLAAAFLEGALSVIVEMDVQKEPCTKYIPGLVQS